MVQGNFWSNRVKELSESQIEMQVGHYLSYKKIFFWKAVGSGFFDSRTKTFKRQKNPYALNGVPDYCLVIDGKFYGWELKTNSGTQTPPQIIFEQRLVKEGKAPYTIIRSLDDAKRELEKILTAGQA